ncbi:MAG: metallophosphoesterase [Sphingomonadaceae bacterium]
MSTLPATLFHLSDIHFGREDRQALAWVESEIARWNPAALVITGDFTMRARHREYRAAWSWLAGLELPLWLEVGNHDMPYFNPLERIRDPFRRYRTMRAGLDRLIAPGEEVLPGLALVSLQTTIPFQKRWPWVDGWITAEALESCLAQIDALPPGTGALVCGHHPLPERRGDGRLLTFGGAQAMAELARRKVLGVLTGHVHDAFDLVADTPGGRLRMIGAGTLSHRTRTTPPSFNILHWDGQELELHARNFAQGGEGAVLVGKVPEGPAPSA